MNFINIMKHIFIYLILLKLTISSCWLESYGRGVGKPVSSCAHGLERNGALCYPRCRHGFRPEVTICRETGCPHGFRNDPHHCAKPIIHPYGRGAGYVIWDEHVCRRNHGDCEKDGLIWYQKCRAGFHKTGCCICSPNHIPCQNGQKDIGVSCEKKSYGRGVGVPMICPNHLKTDAGLCYDNCRHNFIGKGPVCWDQCPAGWQECGAALCVQSKEECTNEILSIVGTVIGAIGAIVALPFTGGASAAIIAAAVISTTGTAIGLASSFTKELCSANMATSKPKPKPKPITKAPEPKNCGFTLMPGSAIHISVVNKNYVYVVNSHGNAYLYQDHWKHLSGFKGKEISSRSTDGKKWIVGTNIEQRGFGIFRIDEKNQKIQIPGSAIRIAVGPIGFPWVIDNKKFIYRFNGVGWNRVPGTANDIGIGGDGSVWIISNKIEGDGGFAIYKYNALISSGWEKIPGSAIRIDVGPKGLPWAINKNKDLYKYDGYEWQHMRRASDVGIGNDGSVWIIGDTPADGGFKIHRYNC